MKFILIFTFFLSLTLQNKFPEEKKDTIKSLFIKEERSELLDGIESNLDNLERKLSEINNRFDRKIKQVILKATFEVPKVITVIRAETEKLKSTI